MPSGTVIVADETAPPIVGAVGLYARVSSSDQNNDLDAQLGRLAAYASANTLNVSKAVAETGSGLDGHRRKLMKLLADPAVTAIVVEHRDRLMRFGAEYVEADLFGGRKLFNAQFDLAANGYESLGEWREDWRSARSSQFFVIGSKDETGGCQGCVAHPAGRRPVDVKAAAAGCAGIRAGRLIFATAGR